MNNSFIIKSLQNYLDSLGTKDVKFLTYINPEQHGTTICLGVSITVSDSDVIRNGIKVHSEALSKIRNSLLESNLFMDVRKDLDKYEKLKNMKFVLDGLKELNLQEILNKKDTEDEFLFENSQLNSYLGRK